MKIFPAFQLSIWNGFLLLALYFLGLILSVLTFSKEHRAWLFYEPAYPRSSLPWFIILVGRVAAVSLVISMFFTPLRQGTAIFYVGLLVYLAGFCVVMVSLQQYRRAPGGEPVRRGLYRYSRNPQWVGLVLVFLGTFLAVGVWIHLFLLVILVFAYHFQILLEEQTCLREFGKDYRDYMSQVPRYLLV